MLAAVSSQLRAEEKEKMIRRFEYRNLLPLYVNEELTVSVKAAEKKVDVLAQEGKIIEERDSLFDVWIENKNREVAVKGRAFITNRVLGMPKGGEEQPPLATEEEEQKRPTAE